MRSVLNGLGDMIRCNAFLSVQICNGTCDPQDPVIASGCETHCVKRHVHQLLTFFRKRTVFTQLLLPDGGIDHPALPIPIALNSAGSINTLLYCGRAFTGFPAAEFLKLKRRHRNDQVNPIQQRAGNSALIASDIQSGTVTSSGRMPEPAAFTGIHGADEHETAGILHRAGNTGNRDLTVFQRLAQHFQHIASKFRKLIEKQNAVVCKADLSRAGNGASACQSCS